MCYFFSFPVIWSIQLLCIFQLSLAEILVISLLKMKLVGFFWNYAELFSSTAKFIVCNHFNQSLFYKIVVYLFLFPWEWPDSPISEGITKYSYLCGFLLILGLEYKPVVGSGLDLTLEIYCRASLVSFSS